MCEVLNADGTPHLSNGRATIEDDDDDFWFGFEQEYFLWDIDTELLPLKKRFGFELDATDVEELNELGSLFESIYDSILFCIESSTERLAAALCLRRVSSAWSCALLKRMASLKGRVDRLTSEKRTLKGIKRTAHAIYEEYYSDDLDFANY